ncbi:MAG: hypothetical protein NTV87_05820 [Ignavibacteriae bacterium]|nr:hypothetical protein [Ignavibacteriota bacterium]
MKKLLLVTFIILLQSYGILFGQTESATGNIKGTLTWQYNKYVGTKPDVDALVYVIKEFQEDIRQYKTRANGYGNYEINDIPVGNYFVVLISFNTTQNPKEGIYWGKLGASLSDKQKEHLRNMGLGDWKYKIIEIKIKENKTVDVSHDFGNTYY